MSGSLFMMKLTYGAFRNMTGVMKTNDTVYWTWHMKLGVLKIFVSLNLLAITVQTVGWVQLHQRWHTVQHGQ